MNRVQYQAGLPMLEFFENYGTHEQCEELVRAWRWPAKHPSFAAVNTILGNLKTALTGTYHAFGFEKYAHRYLAQVQYLFNRRYDLRVILTRLASVACRTRPCPLSAMRIAEESC